MFESITTESPSERLKRAAIAPMAAFLFAQFYFLLYPLFTHVPAALFWSVDAILLAGAVIGAIAIVRSARVNAWLALPIAAELLCAWQFLALTFPWL